MFKITSIISKFILVVMILGIGLVALPVGEALASGAADETEPPVPPIDRPLRLERIWARELAMYQRQGKLLDSADEMIERVQSLIDRATEKGLDASAVQEALDAFEDAVQDARPIHQSAHGIVTSHKGFDENGKVTDLEQARETVRELGEHLRDFHAAMDGTGRDLQAAIKEFFRANRPPRADKP